MNSLRRRLAWTTLVIAGLGCGAEPTALDEAGNETGLFDTLGQIPAEARVHVGPRAVHRVRAAAAVSWNVHGRA